MLQPWNSQWPELRDVEALPLPVVVHLSYPAEGWLVEIGFLTDLGPNRISLDPIFSHREPYDQDNGMRPEEAQRVQDAAVSEFSRRLRTLLEHPNASPSPAP